jgi:hypothetical protein
MKEKNKKMQTKKISKVGVSKVITKAAVGRIIPINLTVGHDFDKSDKIIITAECCGPYHQCHCPSMVVSSKKRNLKEGKKEQRLLKQE